MRALLCRQLWPTLPTEIDHDRNMCCEELCRLYEARPSILSDDSFPTHGEQTTGLRSRSSSFSKAKQSFPTSGTLTSIDQLLHRQKPDILDQSVSLDNRSVLLGLTSVNGRQCRICTELRPIFFFDYSLHSTLNSIFSPAADVRSRCLHHLYVRH